MLGLHGIAADDEIAQVVHAGHGRTGLSFESRLTPAEDSLVGFQLHEDIRAVDAAQAFIECDAEHLHAGDPKFRADILECFRTRWDAGSRREESALTIEAAFFL